jgi:hypothetical protein
MILFRRDKTYKDLYFRILQIGQSRLLTGISYNKLLEILAQEGYDTKDEIIETAIKHWFYESFFHISDEECPLDNFRQLKDHLECSFVLRGEHSLTLVDHDNSQRNILFAWIALFMSTVGIGFSILQTFYTQQQLKQGQQQTRETIQNLHKSVNTYKPPTYPEAKPWNK